MISMALFQTIGEWHKIGVGKREIGRRLGIDIKTVRRIVRKIEAGAAAPKRQPPASKLDPFGERIVELATSGRTAWNVYLALLEAGFHSNSSGLACFFVSTAHTPEDTALAVAAIEESL